MIDGFYLSANQNGEANFSPWAIKNAVAVGKLVMVMYVTLDDIYQLRG